MLEQNTAEVTVASNNTKQYLLKTPIFISGEKLMIQIPSFEPLANPIGPEALSTTILVKGLPIEFSQIQVTVALYRLLGTKNVIAVTYNRAQDNPLGRHDGMASIRCLNAVVYTSWCDRRAIPLLGKQVDFSSYVNSLSCSFLPPTIIAKTSWTIDLCDRS